MCGDIEDNGWYNSKNGLIGPERCSAFFNGTGLEAKFSIDDYKEDEELHDILSEDICEYCFNKYYSSYEEDEEDEESESEDEDLKISKNLEELVLKEKDNK
jgi:hypothetical protein